MIFEVQCLRSGKPKGVVAQPVDSRRDIHAPYYWAGCEKVTSLRIVWKGTGQPGQCLLLWMSVDSLECDSKIYPCCQCNQEAVWLQTGKFRKWSRVCFSLDMEVLGSVVC